MAARPRAEAGGQRYLNLGCGVATSAGGPSGSLPAPGAAPPRRDWVGSPGPSPRAACRQGGGVCPLPPLRRAGRPHQLRGSPPSPCRRRWSAGVIESVAVVYCLDSFHTARFVDAVRSAFRIGCYSTSSTTASNIESMKFPPFLLFVFLAETMMKIFFFAKTGVVFLNCVKICHLN